MAVPPRSPDNLRQTASDIVVGEVKRVHSSDESRSPGFVDTVYTIDLMITKVEKGAQRPKQNIQVRASQIKDRPRGWAGPQGHDWIPAPGDRVRMFLHSLEGALWALTPNGIEKV
jgi:hypothetical protein